MKKQFFFYLFVSFYTCAQVQTNNMKYEDFNFYCKKILSFNNNDSIIKYGLKYNKLYKEFLKRSNIINYDTFNLKSKLIFYFLGNAFYKKNETDSALKYLYKSLSIYSKDFHDTFLVKIFNTLGNIYFFYGEFDSALVYYNKFADFYLKLKDTLKICKILNNIGLVYYEKGNYEKAIEKFTINLNFLSNNRYKEEKARTLNNIGKTYGELGKINEAIKCYYEALKIQESLNNYTSIALLLNNLGILYFNQNDFKKSLEHFYKGLEYLNKSDNLYYFSLLYNNLGNVYLKLYKNNINKIKKDSLQSLRNLSLDFFQKSVDFSVRFNDNIGYAYALSNIGELFYTIKDYRNAYDFFSKALNIYSKINDSSGIAICFINIGNIYLDLNKVDLAKNYADNAYKIAKKIRNAENIKDAAKLLDDIYYKIGNYKLSRQYYEEYIKMRDSIQNEEANKFAQQKYYQYQYEKKATADSIEHIKALQIKNLEIAKQKNEARKNKIIASISIAGIIVVFAFLVFVYRSLQITRRHKRIIEEQKRIVDSKNIELAQQNDEITRQRDEITKQRDEIQNQRDLIQKQKDEIEYIHNELKSSINYAKRIQETVLPSREAGKSIKRPHFIMFKPKDVVSGDFYWYTEIGDTEVYAVADCTGHGVPGGFMSMLGIALLNEIVRKKEITQANQILNELRKEIITALKQRGIENEQKDGMDISLLVIENDKGICQWSGANNPLYIVSNSLQIETLKSQIANPKILNSNNGFSLLEIEPDSMPVAIHPTMTDFTNHVFPIPQNAYFYLFSDGFADQLGGERNKKYGYKRLRELLLSIADKDIEEQGKIIEQEFEHWKGSNEQIDDVTMLVVKIFTNSNKSII